MTIANPDVDYVKDRLELRSIYVNSSPLARLRIIRKRLTNTEIGATRLITIVSGVEALARSLVVHAKTKHGSKIEPIYQSHKDRNADVLVEDVLNAYKQKSPSEYFSEDTWPLFREAVSFRNLIVHECTFLGQDKYPSLIQAAEEVLEALVVVCGLEEPR